MIPLQPRGNRSRPPKATNQAASALESLTPREREVLAWLCECKRDSEIATILNISTHTVSKHLQKVFRKLGVESRLAAARTAIDGGFDLQRHLK